MALNPRPAALLALKPSAPRPVLESWIQRYTTLRIGGIRYLDEFAVGSLLFLLAHVIFILSRYAPTAYGYESRTQISITRFALMRNGLNAIAKEINDALWNSLAARCPTRYGTR